MFVSFIPSCLCFSPPSYPFLQGLRYLNQVSILWMLSFSILLPSMFLSGDSQEYTNGASSSLFFVSFPLRWIQFKLSIFIIFLSLFLMLSHADAPLNHSLLPIHLFWSAEDISQDLCFHSQPVQDISRLLYHSSHCLCFIRSWMLILCMLY